jgi:hypothetical protein
MEVSKTLLRGMTKVLVDMVTFLEDVGYDMSDVELELNGICSDYADEEGNGFAEFRRMVEED